MQDTPGISVTDLTGRFGCTYLRTGGASYGPGGCRHRLEHGRGDADTCAARWKTMRCILYRLIFSDDLVVQPSCILYASSSGLCGLTLAGVVFADESMARVDGHLSAHLSTEAPQNRTATGDQTHSKLRCTTMGCGVWVISYRGFVCLCWVSGCPAALALAPSAAGVLCDGRAAEQQGKQHPGDAVAAAARLAQHSPRCAIPQANPRSLSRKNSAHITLHFEGQIAMHANG